MKTSGKKLTSSNLQAIKNEEMPTSCRRALLMGTLDRKRSMMFTVSHSVAGYNLNLKCTSTNQSTRMERILLFKSSCLSIYGCTAYLA